MLSKTLGMLGPVAGLVLMGAASIGHAQGQGGGGDAPPPAVRVVTATPEDVTLTATLPGRVTASDEAEVRPQVAGIIVERAFEEGGPVEEGDLLYRIDPATYEAAVAEAQAGVAQAEAQLKAARREADRLLELEQRNVASQQSLDEAIATRDSAEASLQLAQAGLNSAQIELDRTTISARLSGEIGLSRTSPGALVTTGQTTPLAVIRKIDPVYVDVTQSAADILRWREGKALADMGDIDRTVSLTLADGSTYAETGELTAAEPFVDQETGVITLRMRFANPDKLLLPGMYVQVEVPTQLVEGVYLIPQEGVTRDRRGRPQASVVRGDDTIEVRDLEISQNQGSNWVVTSGLEDGDRVVVAGFQSISEGATVRIDDGGGEGGAAGEAPAGGEQAAASGEGQTAPTDDTDAGASGNSDAAATPDTATDGNEQTE